MLNYATGGHAGLTTFFSLTPFMVHAPKNAELQYKHTPMTSRPRRPVFLNLLRIQMPVGAVLSFAHRVSGLLLFLAIPFLIHVLKLSLESPGGYAQAIAVFSSVYARVGAVLLVWALVHHLLAGIRFLLIDAEIGVELRAARVSAWIANLCGLLALIAAAGGWL